MGMQEGFRELPSSSVSGGDEQRTNGDALWTQAAGATVQNSVHMVG